MEVGTQTSFGQKKYLEVYKYDVHNVIFKYIAFNFLVNRYIVVEYKNVVSD